MTKNHEDCSIKLFTSIYLLLVESSRVVKFSFSTRLEFLSSTSQLDSTLFQKNFNLTQHFSSRVLDLNLSTRLDAISLATMKENQKDKHQALS